jgi:hypothetical protein
MQDFTPEGQRILEEVANRHGVSLDAVATLCRALAAGNGFQAQFNHPELGGMGQWSQGGMIMVGDMFNQSLKYRVDSLCNELANLLRAQPMFGPSPGSFQSQSQGGGGVSLFVPGSASSASPWWPADLGHPASAGAQNDLRYACFPGARRLAIRQGGRVSVYDTGDHNITGFSQQQGGDQSLTFNSQFGLVRVADLPLVSPIAAPAQETPAVVFVEPPLAAQPIFAPAQAAVSPPEAAKPASATQDVIATIERLAGLREKNILTEEEFAAKKSELLSRL